MESIWDIWNIEYMDIYVPLILKRTPSRCFLKLGYKEIVNVRSRMIVFVQ